MSRYAPVEDEFRQAQMALAEVTDKLETLRSLMRARKVAGCLTSDDLHRFMEIDAEVERATRALQR